MTHIYVLEWSLTSRPNKKECICLSLKCFFHWQQAPLIGFKNCTWHSVLTDMKICKQCSSLNRKNTSRGQRRQPGDTLLIVREN